MFHRVLLRAVFSTLCNLSPLSLTGKHNFHGCPLAALRRCTGVYWWGGHRVCCPAQKRAPVNWLWSFVTCPSGSSVDRCWVFLMRGALAYALGLIHNHSVRLSDHSLPYFLKLIVDFERRARMRAYTRGNSGGHLQEDQFIYSELFEVLPLRVMDNWTPLHWNSSI